MNQVYREKDHSLNIRSFQTSYLYHRLDLTNHSVRTFFKDQLMGATFVQGIPRDSVTDRASCLPEKADGISILVYVKIQLL